MPLALLFLLLVDGEIANPYDILGVSPKATALDIRRAFKELSLRKHPDKIRQCSPQHRKDYQRIVEAYKLLSNHRLKKVYDTQGYAGLDRHSDMDIKIVVNHPVGETVIAEVSLGKHPAINECVGRIDFVEMDEYVHIHSIELHELMQQFGADTAMLIHLSRTYPGKWIHYTFSPAMAAGAFDSAATILSWRRCLNWAKSYGFELQVLLQKNGENEAQEIPINLNDENTIPTPYTIVALRLKETCLLKLERGEKAYGSMRLIVDQGIQIAGRGSLKGRSECNRTSYTEESLISRACYSLASRFGSLRGFFQTTTAPLPEN